MGRDMGIDGLMMAAGKDPNSEGIERARMELAAKEREHRLREATMKFQVGGEVKLLNVHVYMEELSPVVRDVVERRVVGTAVVAQIARVGEREWLGVVPGLAIRESGDSADQVALQVRDEVRRVRQMGPDELCRIYFHWAYTPLEVQHVQDYYDLVDGVHFDFDEATTAVADNE